MKATTTRKKFDYSYEEWTAIENAVATVRPGSLTDFERRRLRNAALSYIVNSEGMTAFLKSRRKKEDQTWATVEKLSGQLLEAIHSLSALYADAPRPIAKIVPRLDELRGYAKSRFAIDMATETANQCFYRMILEMWTDLFGGKLGWNTTDRTLHGACVKYFNAVVVPVMGDDSPRKSYVKDLIAQERDRRSGKTNHRKALKKSEKALKIH